MADETQITTAETPAPGTNAEATAETTQPNLLAEAADKTAETTAETKPEEKPEPRAPSEYAEFTKPEGAEFDETAMSEFKSFAKEQDLTQEQAQRILEFGNAKIKAMTEAPYKLWAKTQADWQAEVKADAEIGGTKFEQSIKDAAGVFVPGESNPFVKNAEEAKALREALNMTGAGNNPAMVKLFVKMGKLLAEPGGLTGNPRKGGTEQILDTMYPTMSEGAQQT